MKYAYIVTTPGTCAARPRIEGTRIAVDMIAQWVVHLGQTPEEVQRTHPHLTVAQIHSALAYYYDHRDEVEASLREGERIEQEARKRFPPRLPEKLSTQEPGKK